MTSKMKSTQPPSFSIAIEVVNWTSYKNPSLLEAVSAHTARGLRLRREGRVAGGGGSLLLAIAVGDLGGYPVES